MTGWVATMLAAAAIRVAPTEPVGISGANVVDECQFPGIAAFRAGENSCSGTIVHPRVMVTAAHCLSAGVPDRVRFGESYSPWDRRSDVERCVAYPEFAASGAAADDLAFCVLVDPIDELAPIPLLAGCETEHLRPGTVAIIVGFGVPEDGGSFGRKRYAFTTVAGELRSDGTVAIGDEGATGCIGDSGGPALVQLSDGTWRSVGVLSRSPDCGTGPSTYRVFADRMAWIEEESGFDITPCWDEHGQWEASPQCEGFDADPRLSDEGWEHFCDGARLTPTPTCEPAASDTSSSSGADTSSTSSSASTSASSSDDDGSSSSGAPRATGGDGCGCTAGGDPWGGFFGALCALARVLARRRRPRDRKRARTPARRVRVRARAEARAIAGSGAGTDDARFVRTEREHDVARRCG